MAEIVNLNKARKAKVRADKDRRAQDNRVKHGTPKALKQLDATNTALRDKKLDAKKLSDESEDED